MGNTSSGQRHLPRTKINGQVLPTKEVETQETVNTRARRQGVSKDRKSRACVPQSNDLLQNDAWRKLDAASRRYLDAVRCQSWIVTDSNQHPRAHHSARRPGVERQSQDTASSGPPQLRANDDQALARVEGDMHSTIAVSSGIVPVYRMANRLGCISATFR